jgi:hypothetical protein
MSGHVIEQLQVVNVHTSNDLMAGPVLSINAPAARQDSLRLRRPNEIGIRMNTIPQLNLILAWLWIVLGFGSGLFLGVNFHREDWLGGYSSLRRRLYRLAHISFFGLGAVNLMFYFTARTLGLSGSMHAAASWALVVGAVSMPLCCVLMAHVPRARALFALPVLSLIAGGTLTLLQLAQL